MAVVLEVVNEVAARVCRQIVDVQVADRVLVLGRVDQPYLLRLGRGRRCLPIRLPAVG